MYLDKIGVAGFDVASGFMAQKIWKNEIGVQPPIDFQSACLNITNEINGFDFNTHTHTRTHTHTHTHLHTVEQTLR